MTQTENYEKQKESLENRLKQSELAFLNTKKGKKLEETTDRMLVDAKLYDISKKELSSKDLDLVEEKIANLKWQREKGYTSKVISDDSRKLSSLKVDTTIDVLNDIVNKHYDTPKNVPVSKIVSHTLSLAKGETKDKYYNVKLNAMYKNLSLMVDLGYELSSQESIMIKEAQVHLAKNNYLQRKAKKNDKTNSQLKDIDFLVESLSNKPTNKEYAIIIAENKRNRNWNWGKAAASITLAAYFLVSSCSPNGQDVQNIERDNHNANTIEYTLDSDNMPNAVVGFSGNLEEKTIPGQVQIAENIYIPEQSFDGEDNSKSKTDKPKTNNILNDLETKTSISDIPHGSVETENVETSFVNPETNYKVEAEGVSFYSEDAVIVEKVKSDRYNLDSEVPIMRQDMSLQLTDRAIKNYKASNFGKSIADSKEALKFDDTNIETHLNLVRSYSEKKIVWNRNDKIVKSVNVALEIDDKNSELYKIQAEAYFNKGQYSKALDATIMSIVNGDKSAENYLRAARSANETGEMSNELVDGYFLKAFEMTTDISIKANIAMDISDKCYELGQDSEAQEWSNTSKRLQYNQ